MMVNTFTPRILISIFPTVCYTLFSYNFSSRIWLFYPTFFFSLLITFLLDIVWILLGEIRLWSQLGVKRSTAPYVQGNVHCEEGDCNMRVGKV